MNDKDFVHYQDLYNTDPAVQRLCKVIFEMQERWDDAVYGLDINEYDRIEGHYTIGEYVRRLENDLELAEDDNHDLREKVDELEHKLKTRTVAELLLEAEQAVRIERSKADMYLKETLQLGRQVEELNEKMNTWTAISREYN